VRSSLGWKIRTEFEFDFETNSPSSSTNLGQSQLDAPHLALVLETILADGLQFGITTKLDTAIRDLSLHEAETQWPAMKQREIFKHTDEQIQRDDGGRGRSLSSWG